MKGPVSWAMAFVQDILSSINEGWETAGPPQTARPVLWCSFGGVQWWVEGTHRAPQGKQNGPWSAEAKRSKREFTLYVFWEDWGAFVQLFSTGETHFSGCFCRQEASSFLSSLTRLAFSDRRSQPEPRLLLNGGSFSKRAYANIFRLYIWKW